MSHICGYPLTNGGWCKQLIRQTSQLHCGRHPTLLPQQSTPVGKQCQMRQVDSGVWRCDVHDHDPQWRVAHALGADRPCRVPLSGSYRRALAATPDLDSQTAWLLFSEDTTDIQGALAINPSTPPSLLVQLLRGTTMPSAQYAAAANPSLPQTHRHQLLRDPDMAPYALLGARDQEPVALAALQTVAPGDLVTAMEACGQRQIPAMVFERLLQAGTDETRQRMADYPGTPPHVLERLVGDPDEWVLRKVAENKQASEACLLALIKDPDEMVWKAALGNPNLSTESLQQITESSVDQQVRSVAQRQLRKRQARFVA